MAVNKSWEQDGAYIACTGIISGSELIQSVVNLVSNERFNALKYVITDFTEADDIQICKSDVITICSLCQASQETNPVAHQILVSGKHDLSDLHECYCSTFRYLPCEKLLFQELNEARCWLADYFKSETAE